MDSLQTVKNSMVRLAVLIGLAVMPVVVYFSPEWIERANGQSVGNERLLISATEGDSRAVKRCLMDGLSVDCNDDNGYTPLHYAVMSGDLRSVELLLNAGADPNSDSAGGMRPLGIAIAGSHTEMTMLMLNRGANPNLLSNQLSPLYIAALMGKSQEVEALIAAGADANGVEGDKHTPLIGAVSGNDNGTGNLRKLIAVGANVNAADADGSTPLMAAAEAGRIDAVLVLLKAGADPFQLNRAGRSARMIAVQTQNWRIAELLSQAEQRAHA